MKRILLTLSIAAVAAGLFPVCCHAQDGTTQNEMENPVIQAIMGRRSIRYYTDTPVEREKLMKIAECGINAPNAMNRQDWEVRIIDDPEYFNGATEIMKKSGRGFMNTDDPKFKNAFRNATAAFAIACPDGMEGMLLQNVGLMSENICLAAYSLGLGTCVMGGPAMTLNHNPELKPYLDKLGFSEGYTLRVIIAVGYPDEAPEAKPRDASKIKFVE